MSPKILPNKKPRPKFTVEILQRFDILEMGSDSAASVETFHDILQRHLGENRGILSGWRRGRRWRKKKKKKKKKKRKRKMEEEEEEVVEEG